jgi:hypothetical protein
MLHETSGRYRRPALPDVWEALSARFALDATDLDCDL